MRSVELEPLQRSLATGETHLDVGGGCALVHLRTGRTAVEVPRDLATGSLRGQREDPSGAVLVLDLRAHPGHAHCTHAHAAAGLTCLGRIEAGSLPCGGGGR